MIGGECERAAPEMLTQALIGHRLRGDGVSYVADTNLP